MANFNGEFSKCIGVIDSAMARIKEASDVKKLPSFSPEHDNVDITQYMDEIFRSFEKIEELNAKKIILEKVTNNRLHELEAEFKSLNSKFMRLQSFERQMHNHFENMQRIKTELFEKFKKDTLNNGFLDSTRESMNFLAKAADEDRKESFDVETELAKAEKIIADLKGYMEK